MTAVQRGYSHFGQNKNTLTVSNKFTYYFLLLKIACLTKRLPHGVVCIVTAVSGP